MTKGVYTNMTISMLILTLHLYGVVAGSSVVASSQETISIPAGTVRVVNFQLSLGDTVKGTISVSGGILHPGVDVRVNGPLNNTILDLGRVDGEATLEFSGGFVRGTYKLYLSNPSWLSEKTVTLSYNITINPFLHYHYELITLSAILITIAVIYKARKKHPSTSQLQVAQTTTGFCSQCGNTLSPEAQYCPKCGRKVD